MGAVILEKFLNQAVQAYGSEAAAVSETVATGISSLTDPRGIAAAADAYEGYFPQADPDTIYAATINGLSAEGAVPSPAEFFRNVIPSGEVSKSLNDPTLNSAKELPSFLKNVFGKGGVPNSFADAGIVIEGGVPNGSADAGFIIEGGVPDAFAEASGPEESVAPADVGAEKGIVINWRPDDQKLQSLMKMQTTLESQQSMSQKLALPLFANLKA